MQENTSQAIADANLLVHNEQITLTINVPVVDKHGAAGALIAFARNAMGHYQVVERDKYGHRERSLNLRIAAAIVAAASEQMPYGEDPK